MLFFSQSKIEIRISDVNITNMNWPRQLLSSLDESMKNDIIKLIQPCWRDAAKHLEIINAGISDFMLYYGIVNEITDNEYYCEKYYNFVARRGISVRGLAYAFWRAGKKEVCKNIHNIVRPKALVVPERISDPEAEIKQLKETLRCREKEISLFVEAITARDEKIEKMSGIISNIAKIVS